MAIDVHCHLWTRDYIPEPYLADMAKFLAGYKTSQGQPTTPQQIDKELFPIFWDADGSKLLAQMDEAGIQKAVLLPIDLGLCHGEAERTIEEHNRHLAEVAGRHPDRFVAFFSIDPRRPGALDMFKRSVKEWGCRGIKYFPSSGFRPDEEPALSLLKQAAEWGLPALIHTGPEFPPFDPQLGHPSILDNVLVKLPDLTVIAGHLGMSFWRDLVKIAQERPNLMCDVSAFQLAALNNRPQFCHILRRAMNGFGAERMMFGTDAPPFDPFVSKKQWVQFFNDLPAKAPEGVSFSQQEVQALLHGNAQRLLSRIPRNL